MSLPDDYVPPPRSILGVEPYGSGDQAGLLITCDCGTATHLVIADPEKITSPVDVPFTCGGCQSTTWFTAGPAGSAGGEPS